LALTFKIENWKVESINYQNHSSDLLHLLSVPLLDLLMKRMEPRSKSVTRFLRYKVPNVKLSRSAQLIQNDELTSKIGWNVQQFTFS